MEELWSELRSRLPWLMLNRILNLKGLVTGRGEVKTLEKLRLACSSDAATRATFLQMVTYLEDAVLFGEKYLKYFDLQADVVEAAISHIQQRFKGFRSQDCTMGKRFPFPDTELEALSHDKPELIRIIESDTGLTLVYSTFRKIRTYEDLRNELEESKGAEFVNQYAKIYGIRAETHQFFDIVKLDSSRRILEIRIDNSRDLPHKQLVFHYRQVAAEVSGILNSVPGVSFRHAHNFYSLLRNLYLDGEQGMVKEMAFLTDTNSLKHEKLRSTNGRDLRREPYHLNGRRAVGELDIYRLGISWENKGVLESNIDLHVLGRQHMLSYPSGAYINEAFVRGCYCRNNYEFLLNILREYA